MSGVLTRISRVEGCLVDIIAGRHLDNRAVSDDLVDN